MIRAGLIGVAAILLSSCTGMENGYVGTPQKSQWQLVIHGGAGVMRRAEMTPEMDASSIALGRKTTVISNIMQAEWAWGRRGRTAGDKDPKELLYEQCYGLMQGSPAPEMKERRREKLSLDALEDLIEHLGGLREGRKAIIYVSEGLTVLLPPQLRTADASMGGLGNPGRMSPMTGENNPREQTAAVFSQADLYSQLQDVFTAANRNNAAIYTLDPRGLTAFEYGIDEAVGPNQDQRALQMTQDTLRTMADETDGRRLRKRHVAQREVEEHRARHQQQAAQIHSRTSCKDRCKRILFDNGPNVFLTDRADECSAGTAESRHRSNRMPRKNLRRQRRDLDRRKRR